MTGYQFRPWTLEEAKAVINDFYDAVPVEQIAERHSRTAREIIHQLCSLGILSWEAFNDLPPDAFDEAGQPSCRRTMTKAEFCDRFTAHMLKHSTETSTGGGSMEDYARAVAATYYEDDFQDNPSLTPEECAVADMSYWEDRRVEAPSWLFALLPGTAMKWAMFCDRVRNTWNGRVSSGRPRRSIPQRRTRP